MASKSGIPTECMLRILLDTMDLQSMESQIFDYLIHSSFAAGTKIFTSGREMNNNYNIYYH
jgi:hypothetical protein